MGFEFYYFCDLLSWFFPNDLLCKIIISLDYQLLPWSHLAVLFRDFFLKMAATFLGTSAVLERGLDPESAHHGSAGTALWLQL